MQAYEGALFMSFAERFGLVLARSEDALITPQCLSKPNIGIVLLYL